jgi:elongation factor G
MGFINKMDRLGCSVDTTVSSIKRRLKVEPVLLNVPSGENNLDGLIDLTTQLLIDYR